MKKGILKLDLNRNTKIIKNSQKCLYYGGRLEMFLFKYLTVVRVRLKNKCIIKKLGWGGAKIRFFQLSC